MNDLDRRITDLLPAKRRLLELWRERQETPEGAVAVIGASCRFPGARNLTELWRLLADGGDAIIEVPPDRWDREAVYHPDAAAPGKTQTRWGGFLDDLDRFDADFFGISPREAPFVDPRQRLALELTWEALEDAGVPPGDLEGSRTGVFVATLSGHYLETLFGDLLRIESYSGPGGAHSVVANRVSYAFNLRGPSLALDTACSGSLVAIHLACQALRNGDAALALAGGVNLNLRPHEDVFFSKAGLISPEGRCRTFDAGADGIVRSDGAGLVLLKPLAAALADGDRIRAVIRGSAVNCDGRSNGLMAPNEEAQGELLRQAYRQAKVPPGRLQYVEAHGTATRLGDPIEVRALGSVIGEGRKEGSYCALGSVKSNLGHMEAAAGIGGLIKVLLAFEHRLLPPSIHFQEPNPLIPFAELPVRVQRELGPWPDPAEPLLAGVSGFGFAGTNAHVVLEEPAPRAAAAEADGGAAVAHLAVLSAHAPEALRETARAWADLAQGGECPPLADLAFTAGARRGHQRHRLAVVAAGREELAAGLEAFLAQEQAGGVAWGREERPRPRLTFVFSGQGSHWPGMGTELLAVEPEFRASLEACDRALRDCGGGPVLEMIAAPAEEERWTRPGQVQPVVFALQVALAALWKSWGVVPGVVAGHSLGEVAAAHVAGALSLEQAARVVVQRSRLTDRLAGLGRTAVVGLPVDEAREELKGLGDAVAVAAVNSPVATVVAGEPEAVGRLVESLEARGVFCRPLRDSSVAFHSPQMEPLRGELAAALADLHPGRAAVPVISSVTGGWIEGERLDGVYWGDNLRQPVRFAEVVARLAQAGHRHFLEIGPHPVLSTAIGQGLRRLGIEGRTLASLRRDEPARRCLLGSLGVLYTEGWTPRWAGLFPRRGRVVGLPGYPWQRQRHWFEASTPGEAGRRPAGGHPLLGRPFAAAELPAQHYWETDVDVAGAGALADHRVAGEVVVPGAAFLEMALAGGARAFDCDPVQVEVREVAFRQKLALGAESRTLQLAVHRDDGTFRVFARPAGGRGETEPWTLHAEGGLARVDAAPAPEPAVALDRLATGLSEEVSGRDHYRSMLARGLDYGPRFQGVLEIRRRAGEALARLRVPPPECYRIHPALLDSGFQVVAATIEGEASYLPVGIARLRMRRLPDGECWVHAVSERVEEGVLTADIRWLDGEGLPLIEVEGLRLQRLEAVRPAARAPGDGWLYRLRWEPRPLAAGVPASDGWLVLADAGGVGDALARRLAASGRSCLLARAGEGYGLSRDGGACTLDPERPEDFERLIEDASALGLQGAWRVACLWGLDSPSPSSEAVARLCSPALFLLRALARRGRQPSPRLWLVTRGAQAASDADDSPELAQAPLWGLGRTLAAEVPGLWGGLIDLDRETSADTAAELLLAELERADGEDQVAWRPAGRLALRLERAEVAGEAPRLDPGAAYLITGGLGDLGLEVARWLAGQGARELLLVGRSGPSPAAASAVRELEDAGAAVRVAAVDVADADALAALMARHREEGGAPVRGVVHCAGVLRDGLATSLDPAALAEVLRPKVDGAWNLHRLFEREPLDFFVLFSSVASLLGSPGQANYAAGNAFLDALAGWRRRRGLPALSIGWGPWAGVGMAARRGLSGEHASRGFAAIPPADGLAVLGRLLSRPGDAQAAVIPVDWEVFRRSSGGRDLPLLSDLAAAAPGAGGAASRERPSRARLLALSEDERRRELESYLSSQLGRVLRMPSGDIESSRPLNTLGLDSLMGVELQNRIEEDLGFFVPVVTFLQGLSTTEIIQELLAQIDGEAASPAGGALGPSDSEDLLARLDDLSDEAVDALLSMTVEESEADA